MFDLHEIRKTESHFSCDGDTRHRNTMAEEEVYTGDDVGASYRDQGTEAGASGTDSGGGISQGAMIAIIVVVVTVSVIGSTSKTSFSPHPPIPH